MNQLKKIKGYRMDTVLGRVECDQWVFDESDALAVQENVNFSPGWTLLHRPTGLCFSGFIVERTRGQAAKKLESILALGLDWEFGKFGKVPRRNRKWIKARDAMREWIKVNP